MQLSCHNPVGESRLAEELQTLPPADRENSKAGIRLASKDAARSSPETTVTKKRIDRPHPAADGTHLAERAEAG